jgi:8-oxo-dGTP diphosphatase
MEAEKENNMIRSTLCYIERGGCYLMLYREKQKNDPNAGKWVGIGGKFEPGESAEECLLREVREETGFTLTSYKFLGIVEFRNDACEDEDMYLYLADGFTDETTVCADTTAGRGEDASMLPIPPCNEGDLKWIPKSKILSLNLWEGDRYFLEPMLRGETDLNMRLTYSGDTLLSVER